MVTDPSEVALILRFRDLVTQKGETIQSHAQMCQSTGKVWWGWWAKAREKIPLELFGSLATKAKGHGLEIFLFDSGSGSVYRATCVDMRYDATGDRIPSPAIAETPEYYRDQSFLAWFCFSKLESASLSTEVLKAWAYVDVPEAFESENHFTQFASKMVCSARELRSQDRSIWFIRPLRPADASHELHLLNTTATQPDHFQGTFRATSCRDLLWLSDVHFGHHAFPIKQSATETPLWMALENACQALKLSVGGVLISGDLAWKAQPAEFDQTFASLKQLTSVLRLENYDVLTCPGNHDFAFEAAPADQEITVQTATATAAYADFYRKLFYCGPNEFFCAGRRMLLANAYPIEIVSLNSVHLQQTAKSFQGFGYVGQPQLNFVAKQYDWDKEVSGRRPFRIVMLHHHLVPVTRMESPGLDRSYSLTLDAEAVMQWAARYRVDLVLHGHMHQPSCVRVTRPVDFVRSDQPLEKWPSLFVCGLGSSGVKVDHLGDFNKNTFGVLRFQGQELKVSIYEIHPSQPTDAEHLVSEFSIPFP